MFNMECDQNTELILQLLEEDLKDLKGREIPGGLAGFNRPYNSCRGTHGMVYGVPQCYLDRVPSNVWLQRINQEEISLPW